MVMKTWKWTEKFVDVRDCYVEADTYEEALVKRDNGDWSDEVTVEFYSEELIKDMEETNDWA
jgi:hypothetical protein